jgi:hypothetical protein
MKTASWFLGSVFLGFCAIVGYTGLVHAQDLSPWLLAVSPPSVVTTNGITSAEYEWVGGCGYDMDGTGPLIRHGNHFSYNFDYEYDPEGPLCNVVFIEHTNVVLGALAPGRYTLTTTSWYVPVSTTTFTITRNSGRQPPRL